PGERVAVVGTDRQATVQSHGAAYVAGNAGGSGGCAVAPTHTAVIVVQTKIFLTAIAWVPVAVTEVGVARGDHAGLGLARHAAVGAVAAVRAAPAARHQVQVGLAVRGIAVAVAEPRRAAS